MPTSFSSPRNLALSLAMMALCGVAAFQAGKWTLAEHYRHRAIGFIDASQARQTIELDEWTAAMANLEKAIGLHDAHADFHFFRGALHELRLRAPYAVDPDLPAAEREAATLQLAVADLQQAINAYREALKRGPTMADSWLRLARVKFGLQQFDAEFIASYANALLYARNLTGLQPGLTELSVGFFPQIQSDSFLRPLQMAHLVKVMTLGNPAVHVELMNRYGVLADVCRAVEAEGATLSEQAKRACDEAATAVE